MTEEEVTKKCPYCAEIIKADAIVCRYCHRDLPRESLSNDQIAEVGKLMAWRAFPRSIGMLLGAAMLALFSSDIDTIAEVIEAPNTGIGIAIFSWIGLAVISSIMPPHTYIHNCAWMIFGIPIMILSFWPVKYLAYFLLVGYSLFNGASLILTFLYFGGLWLYDLYHVWSYGA